jgi:hypothetical protein
MSLAALSTRRFRRAPNPPIGNLALTLAEYVLDLVHAILGIRETPAAVARRSDFQDRMDQESCLSKPFW